MCLEKFFLCWSRGKVPESTNRLRMPSPIFCSASDSIFPYKYCTALGSSLKMSTPRTVNLVSLHALFIGLQKQQNNDLWFKLWWMVFRWVEKKTLFCTYRTIVSRHSFNISTARVLSTSSISTITPIVICSLVGSINILSDRPSVGPLFKISSCKSNYHTCSWCKWNDKINFRFNQVQIFTLNLTALFFIVGSITRTQVKCVGRCFRRELITIDSMRRHAKPTDSRLLPIILISPVVPCFGIVISVRVSPSMRFLTAPFPPIIAP